MKKLLPLVFFFAIVHGAFTQTTVLKDNSSWFTFTNKIKLSEKISIGNVLQMRRVQFMENTQVSIIKPSITYKLNNHISFGAGYMSYTSYPNGAFHPAIKKHENRLWQHLTVSSTVGKLKLKNRFIFEERFKDIVDTNEIPAIIDGTSYAQRFRYRILTSFKIIKLKDQHYIFGKISNEIRIRFKTGLSQPKFDQNNFYLYLGYKLQENSKFWVGYGRDHYKVDSSKFVATTILHVAISYDFDLTKKN